MPSRKTTGDEWAAIKSPTILLQASMTSVSCRRSFRPSRCISFGSNSAVACQRSGRDLFSGRPRHSAIVEARSAAFILTLAALSERRTIVGNLRQNGGHKPSLQRMILVLPPHVAGKNIQFSTIFRDCPACDRDCALTQNLDNLLVAQRRIALFAFH